MRRYDEPCSGPGALSPFPSSAVSITNTSGYDFRKGHVSQPALGRQVKKLEDRLEVDLFASHLMMSRFCLNAQIRTDRIFGNNTIQN